MGLHPGEPELPVPSIELAAATISDLGDEDENWLRWSDGCYPYGLWEVSDFLR